MKLEQTIFVVDDNPQMLESLGVYLRCAELRVETFSSAGEFLRSYQAARPGCLVLDIKMPEMTGLELQDCLNERNIAIPIIFVSGNASVRDAVRALKNGSFDFLEKPYDPEVLLARVREALARDRQERAASARRAECQERLAKLSQREKQILLSVIEGKQSKIIADELDVSVSTVDNHRARIMKKLKAETPADLVRAVFIAEPRWVGNR